MWRIQAFLEAEKDSTLSGIPDKAIYDAKEPHHENSKAQYGSRNGKNRQTQGQGHNCSSSNQCIKKWDKLGCIELYKLTTVEERKNMLISMKMCFKCGASFTPGVRAGNIFTVVSGLLQTNAKPGAKVKTAQNLATLVLLHASYTRTMFPKI